MVYADISSLYENGEHYDSLYGGASPGNDDVEEIRQRDQEQDQPRPPMITPAPNVSYIKGDLEDPEDQEDLENIPTPEENRPSSAIKIDYLEDYKALFEDINNPNEDEWFAALDEALKPEVQEEGEPQLPVPIQFPPEGLQELIKKVMSTDYNQLDQENLEDIFIKYKTICNPGLKPTNEEEITLSVKNLYEYFNCRVYFLRILPLILNGQMRMYKNVTKEDFNLDTATVETIIKMLDTWNPETLQISKDKKDRKIKIKNHSIGELNLFKDILKKIFSIFRNKEIINNDYIIEFISSNPYSKLKTLFKKLEEVYNPIPPKDATSFFNFMSRDALTEPTSKEIIDRTNRVIDSYLYKELLDLTYEIRDLLLDYHLKREVEEEAAEKIQEKWKEFKERQTEKNNILRLEKAAAKFYENENAPPQPNPAQPAEPVVGPAQLQPDAGPAAEPDVDDDSPQSNPLAKQRFKKGVEDVIKNKREEREEERDVKKDLYKGMLDEVEQEKSRLDQEVVTTKEKTSLKEMPLEKGKEESIKEIIENEKKLYLSFRSFRMKTGEVPLVLSLENDIPTIENDIPTIYYEIKEMTPEHYDGYSKRELDSKEVFDELGKFFKKIDINNIENDIPLIQEISTKIDDTKKEMDEMINKYKQIKTNISINERNLKPLLQNILNQKDNVDEEHIRLGGVTPGVYSGVEKDNIMDLLKIFLNKWMVKETAFIGEEEFAVVENLFTKERHYLDFKKNILTINRIIELIEKYNVYIDSYLSIAKYIALEKICDYLIRVYYRSDKVNSEKIFDETNLLFKNLITTDIIKGYHLNDEMDYSQLFFDGIEKTLNRFNQENINYSIIAQITEKFKPTEKDVPEGVIVPLDVAEEVSDVTGVAVQPPVQPPDAATGGGKRRRLTNKKRNRRERTNKKRRSVRKTNRRNTKRQRTPKKRILKTERTLKKNTLKKRRV